MKNVIIALLLFTSSNAYAESITIGTKIFTEQVVLGEIMAQMIEAHSTLEVGRKFNLGSTMVVFEAIKNGDVDIYAEYTGTALASMLKLDKGDATPQDIYERVKAGFQSQYNIAWLKPFGLNDTWALITRNNDPDFAAVKNISDLKNVNNDFIIGIVPEMETRPDGYNAMRDFYQLTIDDKQVKTLDPGLLYQAISEKAVDVIIGTSTDGRNMAFDLRVLNDDQNFFPPYWAAPLVRQEALDQHPEIKKILNQLAGRINDEAITHLNDQVDRLKQSPHQVARNFLVQEGFIQAQIKEIKDAKLSLLEYFWAYKHRLWNFLLEHLTLTFIALIITILVGIPLGIIALHVKWLEHFIFGAVNLFQTIPSLALLGFLIPILGIGAKPAIVALFLYALLPIVRNTFTGIKEIDAETIQASRGLGMTQWQILKIVQMPLAAPMIMAGIRTATVIMVGTATLAAFIGAGGLGTPIFRGITSLNSVQILFGAIPAALLAIILDRLLHLIERALVKS